MQGKLSRLSDRAKEYQNGENRCHASCQAAIFHQGRQPLTHYVKLEAACSPKDCQHPQQQAKVADAVSDEGFLAGICRTVAPIPKADEQVRAHTHKFPKDINL